MGRWSSDAFLHYIRKQVEQFSRDLSKRMLNFCSTVTSQTSAQEGLWSTTPQIPSITGESQAMTPDSITIVTMPKHEEILDAKNHDGYNCLLSPFMRNLQQSADDAKTINGESIFSIADGIWGRGELNKNSNSKPNPHLVHLIA